MKNIQIAIDGPAGAGKSTIAKEIARRLHFMYIDTGAMYRAVGYYALQKGLSMKKEALLAHLDGMELDIRHVDGAQKIYLGGEDITGKIRTQAVSMAASDVAKITEVRLKLVELQRNLAKKYDVIMDGRDIGTYVLPDAQIKIFLTADVKDRAKRRYDELIEKGEKVTFDFVLEDMIKRDDNDSNRAFAPLKKAQDAIEADTTGYALDDSIRFIYELIAGRLRLLEEKADA